jgi:hypothetical protein
MTELTTEEPHNVSKREAGNNVSPECKLQLLFLGVLSISFIGYFALRGLWMGVIMGHTAGLSIMGFYGCLAGAIANKKGYNYARAFQMGFFLPIILGGISAFVLAPFAPQEEGGLPVTCGGWVSLAAGIVVVIVYLFRKRTDTIELSEI